MTTTLSPRAARLAVANDACRLFVPDTRLEQERGYVVVVWTDYRGDTMRRRWLRSGSDFYPTWYAKWAHGGTCCTALSQLVRWIQDRPVLPLYSWKYWCGEGIGLAGKRGAKLVETLRAGGYPEEARCVLCGGEVEELDWWSLHGVSGPCCRWTTGCRQKGGVS